MSDTAPEVTNIPPNASVAEVETLRGGISALVQQHDAAKAEVLTLRGALVEGRRLSTDSINDSEDDAWHGLVDAILARTSASYANLTTISRDRLAELERDRERLDWIEANGDKTLCCWNVGAVPDNGWTIGRDSTGELDDVAKGETARAAIDAAMREGKTP